MTPCTAGEIRPLLADMIPDVDTTGMGTYEIMNLIKALLKDRPKIAILDRLKAMIPEATAPAMTLNEVLTTIERRLVAGKALDTYLDQVLDRLKAMVGVDIGNVDDGLALAEAKIKAGAEAQAENAYMHRIMGAVKAKVGALLLNQREKITDVCQALDMVQAEYAIVKDQSLRNAGLAAERENMISDVIGELRLILSTPKTEDLTLAKIMDMLKANHQRLCGAVHVLTTTPMDRVVNETVRVIGSRDYYVKALLSRFLDRGVNVDSKTVEEVLAMIEAEQKTLTERLGTSYAREIELTRDLTEAKTRLATAGKESADLARALHLAEDKINAQAVHMGQGEYVRKVLTNVGVVLGMTDPTDVDHVLARAQDVIGVSNNRERLIKDQRTILTGVCGLLGLSVDESTYGDIVDKVGALVQNRSQVREDLRLAPGERVDLHGMREDLCKAVGLPEHASMPTVVARTVEALSAERKAANMAERSTLARFRDDMRTVLGEPTATAKYMVDTVDEMRRDLTTIKNVLGMDWTATTGQVVIKIQTQTKNLDRVRDAIGLRESAPMDYVVQRIADTRRGALWAQDTVKEVSRVLFGDAHEERGSILRKIADMTKDRDQAQERFATPSNGLCDDLDMPTGDMDAVRRRVRDLVVFEQDVIKTMGGSDRDQVRDGIGVLQSEYKAQTDTFTILRQILGLGVGCALTTIVETVDRVLFEEKTLRTFRDDQAREIKNLRMNHAGPALAQDRLALIRFLDMAESTTWHEITNEVVRRISYKDGVLAGIGDSIKTLAQIVGLDPTVAALPVPGPLPYAIDTLTAIKDCLLAVVGHPGGESLSLNAVLSVVQSKVSAVALSLGLSEYASLDVIKAGVENLRKDRDLQARTITTLTTNQDAQIQGRYKIRERLLTILCEDPNRAKAMTTDEVVNLLKSKFACLALNLSLPEDSTLNTITERIQGMTPSALILRDLILAMGARGTMDVNEAMREATERIKGMREGMHDLLSTWS